MLLLIVLTTFLIFSLIFNVYLWFSLKKKSQEKINTTYDAKALIHDLTSGIALVEIRRIAPEQIFLRSPKSL